MLKTGYINLIINTVYYGRNEDNAKIISRPLLIKKKKIGEKKHRNTAHCNRYLLKYVGNILLSGFCP